MSKKKMIAITIDPELHEFFKWHAKGQKKTVSGLISEHIFNISSSLAERKKSES